MRDLIRAGLISPPLTLRKIFRGHELRARVEGHGSIIVDGKTYDSVSTAKHAAAAGVSDQPSSYDGWYGGSTRTRAGPGS
jgi:hypothetical protein